MIKLCFAWLSMRLALVSTLFQVREIVPTTRRSAYARDLDYGISTASMILSQREEMQIKRSNKNKINIYQSPSPVGSMADVWPASPFAEGCSHWNWKVSAPRQRGRWEGAERRKSLNSASSRRQDSLRTTRSIGRRILIRFHSFLFHPHLQPGNWVSFPSEPRWTAHSIQATQSIGFQRLECLQV